MTDSDDFYWRTARDSLLTEAALAMFSIAAAHDGESFDDAKTEIDSEYEQAMGLDASQRHGGNFQTFVRVFEEAGWMWVNEEEDPPTINMTDAGRQAMVLLNKAPGILLASPYYLIELLSRYQLNNPSGPGDGRNVELQEAIAGSNIFPYWTIWKIMRSCDNRITVDELRRFVFRLQDSADVEETIAQIHSYRSDVAAGLGEDEINSRYPEPLAGSVGEPKYIMARAGIHIGPAPSLIRKPNPQTYEFDPIYLPLIDEVLANEPVFKDKLDAETWFADFGRPVELEEEFLPFGMHDIELATETLPYTPIDDADEILKRVLALLDLGKRNILFEGAPGTSKTTYALNIGARLADNDPARFKNVQFHQSMSYDDFMEGYVPTSGDSGTAQFELHEKGFLKACKKAEASPPEELHVVVIDELNRGDPSRIFGEALTYIERRDEYFRLAYSGNLARIPTNLVILATRNPYDKTIADIDQALDRRFEKIYMPPDRNILRKLLVEINGMPEPLAGRVIAFFDFLTSSLRNRIGHAYFKDAKDEPSLHIVWEHQLQPVLAKELQFNDALHTSIAERFEAIFEAGGAELEGEESESD